ncbi:MAG: sterol desaturase family protein [Alphaproteobacteria bacterium]
MTSNSQSKDTDAPMSRDWYWHPDLPIQTSGVFSWPPNPVRMIAWIGKSWLTLSTTTVWIVLALAAWQWATPALSDMKTLSWDWVAFLYVRNLIIMTAVAGGLHLYFYTLGKQGMRRKFDKRGLAPKNRTFTFNNQIIDNMFWTLASGVTIWTVYEVAYYWLLANAYLPMTAFADNPIWFVALFVIIPIWASMHFYWVHRFLHWPPMYRLAHALHHRNVSIGPWTGISMHPVEHALYFSSAAIHFVVASHPLHMIFHLFLEALNPACSHSGYDGVEVGGKTRLKLGDFFHQLHHRHFECNYGTAEMPWDKWFGSFHDGSPEASVRIKERRRKMHARPGSSDQVA